MGSFWIKSFIPQLIPDILYFALKLLHTRQNNSFLKNRIGFFSFIWNQRIEIFLYL
jgi:hypothetical protein